VGDSAESDVGGDCGNGAAENSAQTVHGVHSGQQGPTVAVLDADAWVVDRNIDHTVGGRRHGDSDTQHRQVGGEADRQQGTGERRAAPPAAPGGSRTGSPIQPLFDDPIRIMFAGNHPLASASAVAPADLALDTWIRAHYGSAADLVERFLARHRLRLLTVDP
jgi:hypothetical protein